MTDRTGVFPFPIQTVPAAQRVAIVFHQPKRVLVAKLPDGFQVERVTQRMGQHHRFGARGKGFFQPADVDIIGGNVHVYKNRYGSVLHDRRNGGGKTGRHGNHLVAAPDAPFA